MSLEFKNPRKRKHSDDVVPSPLDLLDGAGAGAVHDEQLIQNNDDRLSARGLQAGNIYSGLTLGGQTRAILGNVFHFTIHDDVISPSMQTEEEQRHEKRSQG